MNLKFLLTTLSLASSTMVVCAQTASSPASSAPSSAEKTIQEIKNPTPWLNWGGDIRLRNEYFNNALSLSDRVGLSSLFAPVHEQDYFRFRSRVWFSLFPTNEFTFNFRLSSEPREFMKPSTMNTYFKQSGMEPRYGIIDTLNVQLKKPMGIPATLTLGRQDIMLGDGWLVGDGTPGDGSFTSFVDAARLTYQVEKNTTVDVIGLVEYGRPDAVLPTLGPSTDAGNSVAPFLLTDQNEKGAILWVANKSVDAANVDGYFIYKHDNRLNDPPKSSFGDDADIYTIGGRLSGTPEAHVKYSAEGAYQFGRKKDPELNQGGVNPYLAASAETTGYRHMSAFGVNTKLTYLFKDRWNDRVSLSYEYLSGDDPGTGGDEMFDVLWGRWPRWSEMYNIYSYVAESRCGQTANIHRLGPTWLVSPTAALEFSASYYAMWADQAAPTRDFYKAAFGPASPTPFSGSGNYRGDYLQGTLKYKFNTHLSGHLWAEEMFPGNFYASRHAFTFLRAEVMLTF